MEIKRGRVNLAFGNIESLDIAMNGQKSPIIFLHGLTSSKETWNNVMQRIAVATGRKAYAYDARNHGDSGLSDDFTHEIMQDDLLEFMDCLQIKCAVLVGHSMGGTTVMFFSSKMRERVEKLIIEDISPRPVEPYLRARTDKYIQLMKYAIEQIPPEVKESGAAKAFLCEFLLAKVPKDQRSTRHGEGHISWIPVCQDESGKFKWKTNFNGIGANFRNGITNICGIYNGPTLFLYGTLSPYKVFDDRDFIRQYFPNSEFRPVEGATHWIHMEYEDIFVREVVEFINES